MWPDTRLLDLFGIELPIVQAPMANATGVEMAVAVAKAGGLGSLPCAMLGDRQDPCRHHRVQDAEQQTVQPQFLLSCGACRRCGSRAGLAHASRALLCRAWRNTAGAPAESRVTALRRGDLRAGRGAEARNRELSFRPAGAGLPATRQGCRLQNRKLGDERQGGDLARRARRRRHHRPRRRGRRASRHVHRDRCRRASRHLRARAADRRCGESSGDCRRRHRRCARQSPPPSRSARQACRSARPICAAPRRISPSCIARR